VRISFSSLFSLQTTNENSVSIFIGNSIHNISLLSLLENLTNLRRFSQREIKVLTHSDKREIYTVIFSSQKVLSQVCPFDSYIIIKDKCHDMTPKKSQPTFHQTTYSYPYQSEEINNVTSVIEKKECSDFKYQRTA
jgi:hypothetical protein